MLIIASTRERAEQIRVDHDLGRRDVWCITPGASINAGYGFLPDEILIGAGWRNHSLEAERLVESIRTKRPSIPVTVL